MNVTTMAAAPPSMESVINSLRGPDNVIQFIPHFVLNIDIEIADGWSAHERRLVIGRIVEDLDPALDESRR